MSSSDFWHLNQKEDVENNPYGTKIQDFLMERVQYVIYLRKDLRFPCPDHYDQSSGAESTIITDAWACDDCWGFGIKTDAYIAPCRISHGTAGIGPLGGEIIQEPGGITSETEIVHFPRAVLPQPKDIILECEWDKLVGFFTKFKTKPRAVRIVKGYVINDVTAYWWKEIEYFSCGIKDQQVDLDHFRRLLPVKLADPTPIEVETTWQHRSFW